MSKGEPTCRACTSCDSTHCQWQEETNSWYVCLDCGELNNIYYRNVKFTDIPKLFEKEKEEGKLYTWEDYEKD